MIVWKMVLGHEEDWHFRQRMGYCHSTQYDMMTKFHENPKL